MHESAAATVNAFLWQMPKKLIEGRQQAIGLSMLFFGILNNFNPKQNAGSSQLEPDIHRAKSGTGPLTNRMNDRWRATKFHTVIRWCGRLLMLAGLFFVLLKLWAFHRDFAQIAADPYLWVSAVLLSVVYGLSEFFLPLGWMLLLRAQSAASPRISWKEAWRLYGKSQIAKYIPGNVFHIAGRHMIANQKGMEHGTLLGAAILEIVLLVICAAVLSLLSLGRNVALLKGIPPPFLTIFAAIVLLVFLAAVVIRSKIAVDRLKRLRLPHLWGAQLSYLAFFSLSCLLFLFVLTITSKETAVVLEKWNVIVGGYALAWVVGFLVPGAPGGVGVREAILLALLGTTLPVAGLLLGILVFRLINTLGDVGFYLTALIAEKTASSPTDLSR